MHDFELGQITMTQALNGAVQNNPQARKELDEAFRKYINCDWGELKTVDKQANNQAIYEQHRIIARYKIPSIKKDIYIITEWDRSATTLLFCDEY